MFANRLHSAVSRRCNIPPPIAKPHLVYPFICQEEQSTYEIVYNLAVPPSPAAAPKAAMLPTQSAGKYLRWKCRARVSGVAWFAPQDFANLQLNELRDNLQARRNKIFLLMEEVRRLRIQQRLKVGRVKG